MNMETRIESEDAGAQRDGKTRLKTWQKVSLVALPIALVAGGVGLTSRGAPAIAAPPFSASA